MSPQLKLILFVITAFISLTALMSSLMMLSVGPYAAYRTSLLIIFLASIVVSVFAVVQIVRLNKKWQNKQLEKTSDTWAEWVVEKEEWKQYKQTYIAEKKIRKDAIIYSIIASVVWFLFMLLVISSTARHTEALVAGLTTAPVFGALLFVLINCIAKKKLNYLTDATKVHVKGYSEMILINNKPIFLNTPGLKPCAFIMEEKNGVFSALLILESISPRRRLTQEHRIPFPKAEAEIAKYYFEKIKRKYNIH